MNKLVEIYKNNEEYSRLTGDVPDFVIISQLVNDFIYSLKSNYCCSSEPYIKYMLNHHSRTNLLRECKKHFDKEPHASRRAIKFIKKWIKI